MPDTAVAGCSRSHFPTAGARTPERNSSAGVPMAPLVWGERHTANQMVWYTVIMVALTIAWFWTLRSGTG